MNMRMKVLVSILFPAALAWGQASTAQIAGVVRDPSGAAIPSAELKITQTDTGLVRTATSNADGSYLLTSLPTGPYSLEVTRQGFNRYVQPGIVLRVDDRVTIDVPLTVGNVSEQVVVEATTTQIETQTTGIGTVVDNQRVLEMPLNGRNPLELVVLAGMATLPGNGAINNVRNYPTIVISIAGGQGGNTALYMLDGALHEDPYNNLNLPLPFPDALQEFKVETNSLPAQYGYHSGGLITAITKSGTNAFHGTAFEFLRNGKLNARNFFAPRRDTLKRNQFGGVIGGPIKKDQMFFFFGLQRTTQRSDPGTRTAFVPTQAMVEGDFTAITSAACQGGRPITLAASQGFVGNRIAPTRLNSVSLGIAKTMLLSPDPCGRTSYGFIDNQDENLITARYDYQINEKHSIFGRYTGGKLNVASTYNGRDPLTINQYGVADLNYAIGLGHTWVISNSLVSSLRISGSRTNVNKVPDLYKSLKDFGANYTPVGGSNSFVTVTGGGNFTIGSTAAVDGQSHTGPNPSISEDLSWNKGSHQIQFGGNAYKRIMNYWSGVNAVGAITFNGTVTGLGMADFLTGQAVSFNHGTNYGMYLYQYYYSLYVQDSWKLNRRLTVNYGLRWEPYLSNTNKTQELNHFDMDLFNRGFRSSIYTNAPVGMAFSGDKEYACGMQYNCHSWGKFFPRLGIAWDPTGRGRTSIRMSYGMFGDRLHQFFPNQMGFGPPSGNRINLANVNITDPWANYPGGDPIGRLAADNPLGRANRNTAFPTNAGYVRFNTDDYKPMYVHQWNLSIQHQLGDWLLSANYLGTSSIHLGSSQGINPAVFLGLGPCTLRVPNAAGQIVSQNYTTCSTTNNQNQRRILSLLNPETGRYYAGIGAYDPGGTGSYNGLYLAVNKRLSRGISMLANYTWSHCISTIYDQQTGPAGVTPYLNRDITRANCTGADQRQLFTLNMVAQAPKFSNHWYAPLASGWQVAPIVIVRSARQFSIIPGTDRSLTTEPAQRVNLIDPNNLYAANKGVDGWLNTSAFALPALGTYGNLGYNNIKGPGVFQVNLAVSRNFRVSEGHSVQIRAEAFNLPNSLIPDIPVNNMAQTNTFGKILNDISGNNGLNPGNQRIIQLALKYSF